MTRPDSDLGSADPDTLANAADWYRENARLFAAFAEKVGTLLEEILDAEGVGIHEVDWRLKDEDSFLKKARKYSDPTSQIEDLAGVRVITLLQREARRAVELVQLSFDVLSVTDKKLELGIDQFGYASVQFVVRLSKDRAAFPEMRRYEGLRVEIQVRTILQHAWAEIEHDRRYKFSGTLPETIDREFSQLAAQMESADDRFSSIVQSIDQYQVQLRAANAPEELLDAELNSLSLTSYMRLMFPAAAWTLDPDGAALNAALVDLNDSGVESLRNLHEALRPDFVMKASPVIPTLLPHQILSLILILRDESYLDLPSKTVSVLDRPMARVLESFGVDPAEIAERHHLQVVRF
jgi:putative GTP pyrophosphokinase